MFTKDMKILIVCLLTALTYTVVVTIEYQNKLYDSFLQKSVVNTIIFR